MSGAVRRPGSIVGRLAAALAVAGPAAARATPPGSLAVLELAAARLLVAPDRTDGRGPSIPVPTLALARDDRDEEGGGPAARLPRWVRRIFWRWDTYDGEGYGFRPRGEKDGWFVLGEYERPQGTQPLDFEPYEELDSPRRRPVAGDDARSVGAVLDLSELPRMLLALGAGGGRGHLHAYLGWRVTVGEQAGGR